MPELPELEAVRLRIAPRVEGKLITAATVNPKKAHLLRYPVDNFALELPARRIISLTRRGKHMVFATELGGGGSPKWLVINPMLGGRFQVAGADAPVPATEVFTLRIEGQQELRYLDFRDMGRIYWVTDCSREVPAWDLQGPEADSVGSMGLDVFRKRLRRFRDELKDLLRNQEFLAGIGNAYSDEILWEARLLPLRRRPAPARLPAMLPSKRWDATVISSIASSKAASWRLDGFVNPLTLRTNWRAASRISASVATMSAWRRVLMLRHMAHNDREELRFPMRRQLR